VISILLRVFTSPHRKSQRRGLSAWPPFLESPLLTSTVAQLCGCHGHRLAL